MHIDDLSAGDYVTVIEGPLVERFERYAAPEPWQEPCRVEDKSFQGDVLRVEAVDLPFVVVRPIGIIGLDRPVTLDTRKFGFKGLSEKYVNSILDEEA